MNISVRELRTLLFKIENQNLTVKELSDILFKVRDQDLLRDCYQDFTKLK